MTPTSTSSAGRAFVTREEGVRLTPYKDVAGYLTIGVGHLITQSEKDTGEIIVGAKWAGGLPAPVVDLLLAGDLSSVEDAIAKHVKVPLNQNQYDALADFIFNIGEPHFSTSVLLQLLNQKNYAAVPEQLRRWTSAGGKKIPDLVNRRENEIKLWNTLP